MMITASVPLEQRLLHGYRAELCRYDRAAEILGQGESRALGRDAARRIARSLVAGCQHGCRHRGVASGRGKLQGENCGSFSMSWVSASKRFRKTSIGGLRTCGPASTNCCQRSTSSSTSGACCGPTDATARGSAPAVMKDSGRSLSASEGHMRPFAGAQAQSFAIKTFGASSPRELPMSLPAHSQETGTPPLRVFQPPSQNNDTGCFIVASPAFSAIVRQGPAHRDEQVARADPG